MIPGISNVSWSKANDGLIKVVEQVDVWVDIQWELQIAGPRDRVWGTKQQLSNSSSRTCGFHLNLVLQNYPAAADSS